MSTDYAERQRRQNEEYEKHYQVWIETLSPEDREKLRLASVSKSASLEKAYFEKPKSINRSDDERPNHEEYLTTSHSSEISLGIDRFPDELAEMGVPRHVSERVAMMVTLLVERRVAWESARLLRHVIAGFISPGNLRMKAYALCFAAGLDVLNGFPSLRECARKLNVTPAAISKLAVAWRDRLGLPDNQYAKSQGARASYSAIQTQKHWRNQSFTADE